MVELAADIPRWLLAARGGSPEALGQILEAYRGYLLLVAQQELAADLQAKGGASDLVQETFLDAYRDFVRFRGDTEAELLGWLRQLLRHNLADFTRRYRATAKRQAAAEVPLEAGDSSADWAGDLVSSSATPSGQAMAGEQAQAVQRALQRLPDDYRRVLLLRYQDDLSFEAIGRLMERSPNAAEKLWARALKRLQQELEGIL
jgi:RNA polymerase sigma-70 factor (ECF subfamily)